MSPDQFLQPVYKIIYVWPYVPVSPDQFLQPDGSQLQAHLLLKAQAHANFVGKPLQKKTA